MRLVVLWSLLGLLLLGADALKFQSFSAHFKQVVLDAKVPAGLNPSYEGQIFAKAPFFAKWVYTKPTPKEIYMQGKQVIIYEPKLLQATITKLNKALDFFAILKGAKLQKDGRYRAKIGHTTYYLTLKNGLPAQLDFSDKFQNKVRISFVDAKANVTLDSALFEFVPPKGIDIIRQ